jgi:putative flavoprotein involved in K+ transport
MSKENGSTDRSGAVLDTLVIGGGQAGLAIGFYLKQQERSFLILDENQRVGDAWRKRWDSLRLFTPAKYDGLPGMAFPGDPLAFPSKDELAEFFEGYVARFDLPVKTGVRVERLWRGGDRYLAASNGHRWEAHNVVVANGSERCAKVPLFAAELASSSVQFQSSAYHNAGQLQEGPVLVVGLGNSGAEIALEVSRTHPTLVAGKPAGEIPVKHGRAAALFVLPLIRFAGLYVLNLGTPVGRKAAPALTAHGSPLIRTRAKDLTGAGVEFVPRVTGVESGLPVLEDGTRAEVANVIWCTGFQSEFGWIDAALQADGGMPRQYRGVALDSPGLFFLGQKFQYAAASATLPGACRDARYLASKIPVPVSAGSAVAAT